MQEMQKKKKKKKKIQGGNCLLIHGNPENKNKSTDQIVIETLKEKMGEETREIDLNRTHRLGALKNNKV